MRRCFVACSVSLLMGAWLPSVYAGTVALRGHISFPDGGVPIFSTITLAGSGVHKFTSADDNGNYEIVDVPPGTHNLLISAGGKQNQAGAFSRDNIQIGSQSDAPTVIDAMLITDAVGFRTASARAATPDPPVETDAK